MSLKAYRQSIRSAIRGYWSGAIDKAQFISAMDSAINRGITRAWLEGIKEAGLDSLADLTTKERNSLNKFIFNQLTYVDGLADGVEKNKDDSGKLEPLMTRGEMWISRYNEARTQAIALAAADQKREWKLGRTERHCKTCAGLNGRVYRMSVWLDNAMPQGSNLECKGFRCDCELIETKKPITRGKFPKRLLV